MNEIHVKSDAKYIDVHHNDVVNIDMSNRDNEIKPHKILKEFDKLKEEKFIKFGQLMAKTKEEWNGMPIKNIIAWLEKQGEQKPLNKVEQEDVELTDFESALFSAFSDAWQEYLSGKEVNVAKWTREHSTELLEVAREQKPAWSEENSCYYDDICEILINLINSPTSNVNKDAIQKDLDWLMSIGESQLKSAWSEKDENMLQKALSTIRYALSIPADKEDNPGFVGSSTITWLKSLKERMKGEWLRK